MVFLIWLEMVFGIFILECGHVRSATHNSNYSMLSSSLIPNFKLSIVTAMDRGLGSWTGGKCYAHKYFRF